MQLQLRQQELTWHVVGAEVVVLDLAGSVYLKLNGSARTLWELLVTPVDSDALVVALTERYGIDPDRAVADVERFLAELGRRDLVAA